MKMKEEYVYHIDENDNVIDKVLKKEAINKVLMHRGVAILIFNSNGEILVHKRAKDKETYPTYYDIFFSGWVIYGESYDKTVLREVREEIDAKDIKLHFLFKYSYESNTDKTLFHVYKSIYNGPICFQKEEIEFGKFMPLNQLEKLMKKEKFLPNNEPMFKKYLDEYHKK